MREEIEIAGIKIAKADWEETPESIQVLVRILSERLSHVEEKFNKNSKNSSKLPSSDGFGNSVSKKGKPAKKRRGAQKAKSKPRPARKLKIWVSQTTPGEGTTEFVVDNPSCVTLGRK
ncbi:MAG: DUF6444 domain-containing protein [Cyanobacteria bacterium P01_G01_bin.54]